MRARPTTAIVVATSVLVLGSAVAPASATNSTVSDITELTTALADCTAAPNTVVLGAAILAASTSVSIPCDTTIDLGIFDLTLLSITIDAGRELTITGPTDGSEGTLTTNASSVAGAGISTTNATLRVTGGSVHATGGSREPVSGAVPSASPVVHSSSKAAPSQRSAQHRTALPSAARTGWAFRAATAAR